MTLAIPTIPDMPAGHVATEADMDALTAACTFLLGKPVVRVHSTGTTAITASAVNIPFDAEDYDTDGMWVTGQNTRLTVQTPGWYKLSYSLSINAAGVGLNAQVKSTTGANNPQGAGVTSAPHWASYTVGGTTVEALGCTGIWPFYLYALDFLVVSCVANTTGGSMDTTVTQSCFSMEYVST